jgi:UDP-N-acetylmuramoyl-L-alanyl-D-glutamate--2,6-diaminopimelate ligase
MKSANQAIAAARLAGHAILTYGRTGTFLKLTGLRSDGLGQVLEITHPEGVTSVRLDHFAGFQAENALAAAAIVIASGADITDALAAIEDLAQPPGRMQRAAVTASGTPVFVDYSHKPDALKQALAALNQVVTGKVTVVFGCGGDRDAGKRPIMGAIAAAGADRVIVTDDNPRNEDPSTIRQAILEAAPNAEELADRGAAIRAAIEGVGPDDIVLIAGKGHEQGQIVGPLTMPFDDVQEAQAAVKEAAQ